MRACVPDLLWVNTLVVDFLQILFIKRHSALPCTYSQAAPSLLSLRAGGFAPVQILSNLLEFPTSGQG